MRYLFHYKWGFPIYKGHREADCLAWAYNKADKSITTFTRF